MSDHLYSQPDEHLEARITAWVLGEASPFEAAELQSLIEKSPELKLFHTRLLTLHSLLPDAEDFSRSGDEEWKLPAEKRTKLDGILGSAKSTSTFSRESRIRRASFRAAFAIAACFIVTFIISRFYVFPKTTREQISITNYFATSQSEERIKAGTNPESIVVKSNFDEDQSDNRQRKPQAPSASAAKISASYTSDSTLVPLPEIASPAPAQEYGDGNDFGSGWRDKDAPSVRSGDSAIDRNNIDAILNNPGRASDELQPAVETAKPIPIKRDELGFLDDTVRTNPSLDSKQGKDVDDMRRTLYEAQGNYDLGKYDKAKKSYEDALRIDPYNSAARRGMEKIATAKSDYYRAAYDHTRAELLKEVDKAWELSIPSEELRNEEESADPFADDSENNRALLVKPSDEFTLDRLGDNLSRKASEDSNFYKDARVGARLDDLSKKGFSKKKESKKMTDRLSEGIDSDSPNQKNSYAFYDETDSGGFNFRFQQPSGSTTAFGGKLQVDDETTSRSPRKSYFGVVREFTYPTEFDATEPPNFEVVDSIFPITPATPGTFEVPDIDLGLDLGSATGQEMTIEFPEFAKNLDTGSKRRLIELKKALENPAINDSNKQALFGEWKQLNERLLKLEPVPSPQSPLYDLSQEIPATSEPFSTFSLNVSDASFQLARAAIEKGERPEPDSIKPEQFYNAIDYGDPAPSSREPVAAAIDQTAHPVIPGRNLVRISVRTASTGRSAAQPLRLTLLVDQSGSMVREDRRAAMETALEQLSTLMTEQDKITVIGFSRTPRLLADSLPGNQANKLPDLINQTASEGGTNLEQAINLASELALRHKLAGAQNRIVLFTDGAANLGNANPERLSEKIETLRQQGLAFDIAGIGTNDINDNLLAELARHGNGRYYLVGENTASSLAAQLAGAFRPAAENVKVQVKLNLERVGNYKLIGFEKDRLKTEDFRNDSIDAAELAADEAGVAMYQIETLPEGSGEIGEVSVRFRDTASGEMVERTWTIPYESATPTFDKADPKTQLATLSLLAAQKLQTGPLADAIDLGNYSETIARLRQTYKADTKTQQLLNLVGALK